MPKPNGFAVVLALAAAAAVTTSRPLGAQASDTARLEENKRLARAFYQDLWFSRHTDKYSTTWRRRTSCTTPAIARA